MADQKPPQLVADELTTVHDLLQFQRESLVRKVTGVSDEDARWSPVGSGTSLLWLTQHIAQAERTWIMHRFAAIEAQEGPALPADTLAAAIDYYRRTWREVDAIVSQTSGLDERVRFTGDGAPVVNLRWILVHLLEETARHAGHADILRELLDGSTGR